MSQRYATYFAMIRARGERLDASRSMQRQEGYEEHTAFMDTLADDGFVILGGPLCEREERFLFVFAAENAGAVEARLADDPWTIRGRSVDTSEKRAHSVSRALGHHRAKRMTSSALAEARAQPGEARSPAAPSWRPVIPQRWSPQGTSSS